ncbi:MAG: hypothetical protein NDF55_03540 [archaeon GB-1867-005]|nr:hypothetical protein [Candidatus Culexmicrobium cathedralense]
MTCETLQWTDHFIYRFENRYISQYLNFEDLLEVLKSQLSQGKLVEDVKHKGVEGPRYHAIIEVSEKVVLKVVLEKTARCFKLITLWPKSS